MLSPLSSVMALIIPAHAPKFNLNLGRGPLQVAFYLLAAREKGFVKAKALHLRDVLECSRIIGGSNLRKRGGETWLRILCHRMHFPAKVDNLIEVEP